MKKLYIFLVLAIMFVVGALFNFPPVQKTEATFTLPNVTICHKQDGPDLTMSVPLTALPGHLGHGDKLGACQETTPTPTPTPTPTIDPCDQQEVYQLDSVYEEDPCITPTVTPEPTATPSASGNPPTFAGSSNEAPRCPDGATTQLPANVHVIRSGSDATVNFFITQGDSANIYWRVVGSGYWQNAVSRVKPNGDNFVSFDIHDLDPVLGYDFGIQQVQGCGGGQLVTAVVVDGPESQTFAFTYWEWSK